MNNIIENNEIKISNVEKNKLDLKNNKYDEEKIIFNEYKENNENKMNIDNLRKKK